MAQQFRASLGALTGTVPVSAVQSATIVLEVTAKLERWLSTRSAVTVVVPAIQDVSILQGGSVWWCRGHAVPTSRVVAALGSLLATVLDHTAEHPVPAGLLYVVARATDPRHLAPFGDLAEFHRTLARYAASRPNIALDSLLARFAVACSGLPPLRRDSTISDVRRLRRAGGVTLSQIAADTAIPLSLLRELEWGVYTYWSLEHARGVIEQYAERAGLDGEAVARVVQQEQALAVRQEALCLVAPARTSTRTGIEGAAVPFALAAVLIGTILLAAPGDKTRALHQTASPQAAVSLGPTLDRPALQAPDRPAQRDLERRVSPAPRTRPGRIRTTAAKVQQRSSTPPPAVHPPSVQPPAADPLARLARAIAGDGRYKVEPFPRVREDR